VVQKADADKVQRFLEVLGDLAIRAGGLCAAGGMVVADDYSCRVVEQGTADYLTWVHSRCIDRSSKQLLIG